VTEAIEVLWNSTTEKMMGSNRKDHEMEMNAKKKGALHAMFIYLIVTNDL
jgi:hypothetical protein